MTPYDSYMEKRANPLLGLIGGGLRLASSLAAAPYMGQMAGGALKWLGGAGVKAGIPGGKALFGAGKNVVRGSNTLLNRYNSWLNQGHSFGATDMAKVPLLGRIPLGMLGVDTTSGARGASSIMKWTPRRIGHTAIVGGGGALTMSDMFKPGEGAPPSAMPPPPPSF